DYGSLAGQTLSGSIVGMTVTPDGLGYWLVGSDGHVYPFGAAHAYGSPTPGEDPYPTGGLTVTPHAGGYGMVDQNGTVDPYGDAPAIGSATPPDGGRLNQPIISMISTSDGKGYWLTSSDGGVFAYGDAQYFGSTAHEIILWPIVGMV